MKLDRILGYFFSEKGIGEFENILGQNGYGGNAAAYFQKLLLAGIAASVFCAALLLELDAGSLQLPVFSAAAFAVFPAGGYFLQLYFFEQKRKKIEEQIPDLLFEASILPKKGSVLEAINYLCSSKTLLSEEFRKARDEIGKGSSFEESMHGIKKRWNSRIVSRAADLLVLGYNSGADMEAVFRETAEDIVETKSLLRDRAAAMVIEKYTLLFAGAIIVPAILGLLVSMVKKMDFGSLQILGIGLDAVQRSSILEAALLGNQFYIAFYSIIASAFVAFQEGSPKKAFLYAIILLPASIIAYNAVQIL